MRRFIRACDDLAAAVRDAVAGMVGTPEAGDYVRMGADGTPTKKIDQVAEDIVVDYLADHPLCQRLISEELGCAAMGGNRGTIFLDPVDGTYNAVVGIPFYAISIAYAADGMVTAGYVQNLATGETFHVIRGEGAFRNGRPIHVSNVSRLEESAMSVYGGTGPAGVRKGLVGPEVSIRRRHPVQNELSPGALHVIFDYGRAGAASRAVGSHSGEAFSVTR